MASTPLSRLLCVMVLLLASSSPAAQEVRESQHLLGTILELVVEAGDRQTGEYWIDQAGEVGRRLERELRTDDARSDIAKLNMQAGQGPVQVTPDLYRLTSLSLLMSRATGGAYDATVGVLVRARRSFSTDPASQEDAIEAALGHVGSDRVTLHPPDRVELARAGMALDFGAVARGYLAARMAARLRELGATRALLRFGSGIYVAIGPPRREDPWQIPVPRGSGIAGTIALRDRALAITHSLRHDDDGGGNQAHVLDPRSGRLIDANRQAAVIALDAAIATAWSVAMVVDPDGVVEFLDTPRDVEAIGFDEHGEHRTRRFDQVAAWRDARRGGRGRGLQATGNFETAPETRSPALEQPQAASPRQAPPERQAAPPRKDGAQAAPPRQDGAQAAPPRQEEPHRPPLPQDAPQTSDLQGGVVSPPVPEPSGQPPAERVPAQVQPPAAPPAASPKDTSPPHDTAPHDAAPHVTSPPHDAEPHVTSPPHDAEPHDAEPHDAEPHEREPLEQRERRNEALPPRNDAPGDESEPLR
ncbi:MAG TPA: FAD:protein FMN transferase [Candidatus Binatia bacterium]|nr:FAD:protein FMN transferase [Candidatus Binatia bacterium]